MQTNNETYSPLLSVVTPSSQPSPIFNSLYTATARYSLLPSSLPIPSPTETVSKLLVNLSPLQHRFLPFHSHKMPLVGAVSDGVRVANDIYTFQSGFVTSKCWHQQEAKGKLPFGHLYFG